MLAPGEQVVVDTVRLPESSERLAPKSFEATRACGSGCSWFRPWAGSRSWARSVFPRPESRKCVVVVLSTDEVFLVAVAVDLS